MARGQSSEDSMASIKADGEAPEADGSCDYSKAMWLTATLHYLRILPMWIHWNI